MAQLPKGEPAPQDGLLPEQAKLNADARTFHAYVHVPFCRVRCGYCDFNTYTAQEIGSSTQSSFARDLNAEIEFSTIVLEKSGVPARKLTTVFFGGGTPTLLPAEDLVAMLEKLKDSFGLATDAEVTTEANPDSVDEEYLAKLKAAGFTRVSIGMQSAVPHVLKVLERTHNPENVAKAVLAAKAVGLQTSVDLIYGTPTESLEDWVQSLEQAIALNTDHVSAYSLIVEPGTKLARQIKSGEVESPDEDLHAEMYEVAEELLTKAGFSNYEVSNWSKSTETRSRHNIAYWKSMDWWGYGPGAHSHVGGVRWWNVKNPSAYTDRIVANLSPALERELVDEENRDIERVMLEARLSDGMDLTWLKSKGFATAETISMSLENCSVRPK
ncbi:MAG: coproporphyrinogen III oxidase [Micrococcales bacterium]|nr:coproporphyrinogen III oxidase [Micrococcales bacterium]